LQKKTEQSCGLNALYKQINDAQTCLLLRAIGNQHSADPEQKLADATPFTKRDKKSESPICRKQKKLLNLPTL